MKRMLQGLMARPVVALAVGYGMISFGTYLLGGMGDALVKRVTELEERARVAIGQLQAAGVWDTQEPPAPAPPPSQWAAEQDAESQEFPPIDGGTRYVMTHAGRVEFADA